VTTADQARQLADLFSQMADTVGAYRDAHYSELAPDERLKLEQQIQQLDDFCDQFTAEAIQATLETIQGDLDRIVSVTRDAGQALKHLTKIAEISSILSSVADLAYDITAADYGAVPGAIQDIVGAVQKSAQQ